MILINIEEILPSMCFILNTVIVLFQCPLGGSNPHFWNHIQPELKYYSFLFADPKEKTWSFAISDYSVVMRKIQDLKGDVSISELPSYVLQVSENMELCN